MRILPRLAVVSLCCLLATCRSETAAAPSEAKRTTAGECDAYLRAYGDRYGALKTAANEADWISQTHIVEGDKTNEERTRAAEEALAAFTGSTENIEKVRGFQARSAELSPLEKKELEAVRFQAGASPQTAKDLVDARIAAETKQVENLFGFTFHLDGKEITPNEIDTALEKEKDLGVRRKVWESSKEVGIGLRPGLVELQRLRNGVVRALGYKDFFAYMASEYGMTTEELSAMVENIQKELRPIYRELHTWARYELAKRYGEPVPDLIPAHWLPNRWGQDWGALVDVQGFDLDAAIAPKTPEWVIRQAERFYVSLGFPELPKSFWEKSSLYPVAKDAGFKKNTHASAWHIDLEKDVRSLMSVEANQRWYETTHHELGHIYYYLSYSRPEVPFVLREGANRAYHEAIGTMMGLAAMQPRFIEKVGLKTGGTPPDPMQLRLKEALNYVVFTPWSAGTMFQFEKELYSAELPESRWNARWWELSARYQGIAPPSPRDETYCDAATKTHITDDPAAYYDYALANVLLFQIHDHIAKKILHESPDDTCYYGRKEVGDFLRSILDQGACADWRTMLREKTGSDLSAKAMIEYFEPLRKWLVEQNRGRMYTLPELGS
jgi:peptidyl-dipeptidase A